VHYREAATEYAEGGNLVMLGICLDWLAAFDARRGNHSRAADELVQAVELNEALGLTGYLGVLLARLGIVRTSVGDFDAAHAANARAIELGRRLMNAPVLGMALSSQARLLLRLGRFDEAADVATEALDVYRTAGSGAAGSRRNLQFDVQAGTAMAYAVLGFVAQHAGDGVEADRLHREGLGQARLTQNPRAIAVAIEGLAGAAAATGDGKLSAELLGHATQLRAAAGVALSEFEAEEIERVQNLAMALLGNDDFVEAFEQGHRVGLSELVG
jgi:tetratricopeptide (TPR) repeat protein